MTTKEYIELDGEEIPLELTWESESCECDTDRGVQKWVEWNVVSVENLKTKETFCPDGAPPPFKWAEIFEDHYLGEGFEPPKE